MTTTLKVFVATVSYDGGGVNAYTALTIDDLYDQLAAFCEEWWGEVEHAIGPLPRLAEEGSREVVQAYFNAHNRDMLFMSPEAADLLLPGVYDPDTPDIVEVIEQALAGDE